MQRIIKPSRLYPAAPTLIHMRDKPNQDCAAFVNPSSYPSVLASYKGATYLHSIVGMNDIVFITG
jgi:hypothetical protein